MLLIHAVVVVVVLYTDKRQAIRGSLVVILSLGQSVGTCGKQKFSLDSDLKTELSKKLTSVQTVFPWKLHEIHH